MAQLLQQLPGHPDDLDVYKRQPLSISSLSGELTGEEMSHLTGVVQKPESPAGGERALADYCRGDCLPVDN